MSVILHVQKRWLIGRPKTVVMLVLLCAVWHFDTVAVAGVRISHLWKIILMAGLFLASRTHRKIWSGCVTLSLLCLEMSLSPDASSDPVAHAVFIYNFAIIGFFVVFLRGWSIDRVQELVDAVAYVVIASFVPYMVGLVQSLGKQYDMESFGYGENGIVGVFQSPHAASIALAGSLIVVTSRFIVADVGSERLSRGAVLVLGGVCLLKTYVRTGMLMYGIGLLVFIVSSGVARRRTGMLVAPLALVGMLVWSSGWADPLLDRIAGRNIYYQETDWSSYGSGRGGFWNAGLAMFLQGDVWAKFFGVGTVAQTEMMSRVTGLDITSHNAFLDLLVAHGLVGLSLFAIFLWQLGKLMCSSEYGGRVCLGPALFAAYISMCLVQGANWIVMNFFVAAIAALALRSRGQS